MRRVEYTKNPFVTNIMKGIPLKLFVFNILVLTVLAVICIYLFKIGKWFHMLFIPILCVIIMTAHVVINKFDKDLYEY